MKRSQIKYAKVRVPRHKRVNMGRRVQYKVERATKFVPVRVCGHHIIALERSKHG